ncbi:uncharacterized protein LOC120536174 [Polypterus senegalus]|uniref:uncharacterized protein LOC120536174 n=1 Tax=Polypterus senegalus TaxID=55291 RepID=UPI001966A154|nr:uncharacterized protein LOC120536174 [Polypterus senegalus]
MAKERATFFNTSELELLMQCYDDEKDTISAKSNTAASAKARREAWQRIADRINACNPRGVKRSWQQVKTKYKNIVQSANRKMEHWETGGGSDPPRLTLAEELALHHNCARQMMDGKPEGSSSEQVRPTGRSPCVKAPACPASPVDPPAPIQALDKQVVHRETRPNEVGERGMKETYKRYLEEEMEYRKVKRRLLEKQMIKLDLEIQLLEKQLLDKSS